MAKNIINSAERKIDQPDRSSAERAKEKDSKEIMEKAQPLGEGALDVVDVVESAEVSEKASEDKKKAPTGQIATGKGDDSSAAAAVMTVVFPKVDVMRIQVATQIKKEIVALEKAAKRIRRSAPGQFSPFQFNAITGRIRKLRDILDSLLHATGDAIKNLWQKFVKGGA